MKNKFDKVIEGELLLNSTVGRPSEFSIEHLTKLDDVMSRGGKSVAAICAALDISKDTHYRWRESHQDYETHYQQGILLAQAYWENLIRNQALGNIKGSTSAAIFMTCNLFKDDYKQSNNDSTSVNINLTASLPEEKLDALIHEKEEKIKKLENK